MARPLQFLGVCALVAAVAWLLGPVETDPGAAVGIRDGGREAREVAARAVGGPTLVSRGAPTASASPEPLRAEIASPVSAVLGGLPLRATLVEAETGWAVALPWAVRHAEPDDEEEADTGEPPALGAFGHAPSRPTALHPGTSGQLGVAARPDERDRLIAWDDGRWDVQVSIYATSLAAVYPLRTEASVRVIAAAHDGTPVHRFEIEGVRVAKRNLHRGFRVVPGSDGQRLYGIPFFRRQPLEIVVEGPRAPDPSVSHEVEDIEEDAAEEAEVEEEEVENDEDIGVPDDDVWLRYDVDRGRSLRVFGWDVARGRGHFADAAHEEVLVRIRFPETPEASLAGGGGWSSRCISRCRRSKVEQRGDVVLRVLRRDGRPAVGSRVALGFHTTRVGPDGVARFAAVPARTYVARLREPGLVSNPLDLEVKPHVVTRATLREAQGGTLAVRVLTPDDAPAPFATVQLPRRSYWADLRGGVQRIDPYTDVGGERVFDHLTPGKHTLTVRWAGLEVRHDVQVTDGRTQVTVRLPDPTRK